MINNVKVEDCGLGVLISTPVEDLILDDKEDDEDFLNFIVESLDKD